MRQIAERIIEPIATSSCQGAWYKEMRLMAIDGTLFDLPDEAEN
jgi:hypothetical protein